jgi:Transposase DDE domain
VVQLMALAACLQDLFTLTADFLASWTGLIRRQRSLTGPKLAQALVFRWMDNPKATLEDIAADLGVSPQALQQHLGPEAHCFLRELIAHALQALHKARFLAKPLGLLASFPAVVVEDCTSITVPAALAALFPGCGGAEASHGAAAVKLLLRYELKTGTILALSWHAGRVKDAALAARPRDLPPGCLYLADMGFFGAARLRLLGKSCSWITRLPASTCVRSGGEWLPLAQWLESVEGEVVDTAGAMAKSVGTACRLVALRCPKEVEAQRRRKLRARLRRKNGREPSAAQLALCGWTTFATNVPTAVLAARQVWTAYRCRWQVELLIKRAKGLAGWSFSHGHNGNRVLAELLAKVLGLIVLHWGTLLHGPALSQTSATALMRQVAAYARDIAKAMGRGLDAVVEVLRELATKLERIRPRSRRRRKPNTLDRLHDPGLAA